MVRNLAQIAAESRKGSLSEAQKTILLLEIQRSDLNVSEAASLVGLTRTELKKFCQADPVFAERFDDAVQAVVDKLLAHAVRIAFGGSPDMLRFLLVALRPEQFSAKSKLDVKIEDVTKLSDDELSRIIAKCQAKLTS